MAAIVELDLAVAVAGVEVTRRPDALEAVLLALEDLGEHGPAPAIGPARHLQRHAVERVGGLEAGERDYRRRQVDVHDRGGDLPAGGEAGAADEQRDAKRFVVELRLAGVDPVLAAQVAVVGCEHDQRLVELPGPPQLGDDAADEVEPILGGAGPHRSDAGSDRRSRALQPLIRSSLR